MFQKKIFVKNAGRLHKGILVETKRAHQLKGRCIFYWFRYGIPRTSSIVFVKIMWKWDTFSIYTYQSTDAIRKRLSLYTYQSTYAMRKRHIIAVLHISKPWKWGKKWKRGVGCKKGGMLCPVHKYLWVKLEIYEFDQIVYEVADLCTSCEVGLIVYLFNCIFACFVQPSFLMLIIFVMSACILCCKHVMSCLH